jgi:glycerophosphoryl diester phosphodiesterase
MAHRGASAREPENTLVAFVRARELGADAVELDVRRTADGGLVILHNPTLPDGRVLCETASADLPPEVPGLDAALDACAGMWVNVEIKNDPDEPDFDPSDGVAAEVAAALSRRGEDARWLVSSFRRETVDALHRAAPTIATAWLTVHVDEGNAEAVARDLVAAGHAALHPWVGLLSRPVVDAMHGAGLAVNTWTCDDEPRMRELIEWGIDGICTNVPDVAVGLLR